MKNTKTFNFIFSPRVLQVQRYSKASTRKSLSLNNYFNWDTFNYKEKEIIFGKIFFISEILMKIKYDLN